jgi:dihydrofolate synthase/folylpolyglutamate synthase
MTGRSAERLSAALATLDSLSNWERRDRDASMRHSVDPVRDLLSRMGDPQRRWRAVHVAGTKGKGTTSSLVAAGLARAGVRVGLYTSPHVVRVHERIRIDGQDVSDEAFAAALENALQARDSAVRAASAGAESTWFDVLTSAAFDVFAAARVEWAVVECGLGGRLDSTNVIDGEVCVITTIDLEHTAVLGNTRAAIAGEKAGILKAGSTLVTSLWPDPARPPSDDAGAAIEARALALGCPIHRPAQRATTMLGENVSIAGLALDELGRKGVATKDARPVGGWLLDPATVAGARLPARQERFDVRGVPVVLDGAHVASSMGRVLDELAPGEGLLGRPVVILALGRDKDIEAILKMLHGRADRLLCTSVTTGPLRAAELLATEALHMGLEAEAASDPAQALARALELCSDGGWVLAIGSFYLAGSIRSLIAPDPNPQSKKPRC